MNQEIIETKFLLSLINDNRSKEYFDWKRIGYALKNIDENLFDDFINFSKKCPYKYNYYSCLNFWNFIKLSPNNNNLKILRYYAILDNPIEYNKYMKKRNIIIE